MLFKKKLLLKILNKIKPYREEAEGLSLIVARSDITEEMIDELVHLLSQSILHAKNIQQKTTMEKAITVIKKLQSKEKANIVVDQEAADILLQDLEL